MTLADRSVLVTGATSGVGRALAGHLAERGARVVVHGRDSDRLAAVASETGGALVTADLAEPGGPAALATAALDAAPDLSVVVNNAAVQEVYLFADRPASDASEAAAREILVDLVAPIQLAVLLLPALRRAASETGRPSAVLNVTSGLAITPKKTAAVYCAAKSGLRTFTRALRYQLEDEAQAGGPEVRAVEAVLPLVDTPMTAGRPTRTAKISPEQAAAEIVRGLERGADEILVGKARVLSALHRVAPSVAARILRDG